MTETQETQLDATGLTCPLPVLRARKALLALPEGAVLTVSATDPMAAIDLPHFCNEAGHTLLSTERIEEGDIIRFRIRKGSQAPKPDDAR